MVLVACLVVTDRLRVPDPSTEGTALTGEIPNGIEEVHYTVTSNEALSEDLPSDENEGGGAEPVAPEPPKLVSGVLHPAARSSLIIDPEACIYEAFQLRGHSSC